MYPTSLQFANCAKGPSQGGLPVAELKALAKQMGINPKLTKAEICAEMAKILEIKPQEPSKKIVIKKTTIKTPIIHSTTAFSELPGAVIGLASMKPIILNGTDFTPEIKDVLKQVHYSVNIDQKALEAINHFLVLLGNKILKTGHTKADFKTAIDKMFGPNLAKYATAEMEKVGTKDHRPVFPNKTALNRLKEADSSALLAVLEYITAEIAELAGNLANDEVENMDEDADDEDADDIDSMEPIITKAFVNEAIEFDEELVKLAKELDFFKN